MPINPPRPPTRQEQAREAQVETIRFVRRHDVLFTYLVTGSLILAALVVAGYEHTLVLTIGYVLAGLAVLLDGILRGR